MNQYGVPPVSPQPTPPRRNPGPSATAVVIVVAVVGVLVVVVAVGAYLAFRFSGPQHRGLGPPESALRRNVELRMPLEFAPVADARQGGPCPPGFLPERAPGGCLLLDSGGFRVARLDTIRAVAPEASSSWGIELRLTGDDAAAFARLTRKAAAEPAGTPGQRIAIVVGEQIVSAPAVIQPIAGGEVMISGNFTRTEVNDLIGRITGG
ncbi:hypothetical protein GCM10010182_54710 [Actinomadura cremea]|nr:hypothetical protein GCM10010182_54710 [Actinomadura cremea]